MAKRRWVSLIQRFFLSQTCENRSKEQKRRWVFGRHKLKRLTSQSALAERPKSAEKVEPEGLLVSQEIDEPKQVSDGEIGVKEREIGAAIKIQTAFRGFLARKALRALQGLVRLQAIIRGHLVRHQAVTTLKRLQSVVNIHSQACAKRIQVANCSFHDNHQENRGKDLKKVQIDTNNHKRWDDSILTKEEEDAMLCSKREAAMRRERIREYALNHRMSTESEQSKVNKKWRQWLEHWVDIELAKREDLQTLRKKELESQKVKLRNLKLTDTPNHLPRTTSHRKQRSIGEEHLSSPVFPTYMAATESARAKARSLSSPQLRPLSIDTRSASNSPYKHKLLSPISSINSDASSISRVWNTNGRVGVSQRSPSLKGFPGHVKSSKTSKNLSFSSETSMSNWEQIEHFR